MTALAVPAPAVPTETETAGTGATAPIFFFGLDVNAAAKLAADAEGKGTVVNPTADDTSGATAGGGFSTLRKKR